jgi:hypothetical protein
MGLNPPSAASRSALRQGSRCSDPMEVFAGSIQEHDATASARYRICETTPFDSVKPNLFAPASCAANWL